MSPSAGVPRQPATVAEPAALAASGGTTRPNTATPPLHTPRPLATPSQHPSRTPGTPLPPTPGTFAPNFTLPDHHGADHSLAEHRTQHPTLLMFYPFAFSGICGGELQELQSALPKFEAEGVGLLAISCDPMYSLRIYAEREGFGFPLLSDFWPHGAVARAYGVFDESRGCARRGSFLVARDGTVRWSIVNPISEARPVSAYLTALKHLPEGE